MTALAQYAKLETIGLWKPPHDAQRREVAVSFGEATLVIRDMANRPLGHWSLPAVERLNPGEMPALFAPDPMGSETLEIEDDLMIDAIEKVRRSIAKTRPRPGRLRGLGTTLTIAAILGVAFFWVPGAMRHQALSVIPESKREEIGVSLLGHMQRLTGSACRNPLGVQALGQLKTRVLGAASTTQLVVVPSTIQGALPIPGGIILINRDLIEQNEDPAIVAGYILAASEVRQSADPIDALLRDAGLRMTFQLLTTGDLSSDTLAHYAELLVKTTMPPVGTDKLLAAFEKAQVTAAPFAYAIDPSGETTLDLIEADPVDPIAAPQILSDGDWVALQGICGA